MKKLTLDVDALRVESFASAEPDGEPRGSVRGAEALATLPEYCITFTCGDSQIRACAD